MQSDPRAARTDAGLRDRAAMNLRARDLSRVYFDAIAALDAIDAELKTLGESTDSAAKAISARVVTLRQRARGNSITSGIGRLFDLTAAIESSSMPPTDAQHRSLAASVAEFTDVTTAVNALITTDLPALLAGLGRPPSNAIAVVAPPT